MTDQEMVNKLTELARYYAGGGLSKDNPMLVEEVIAIGRTLNNRGGISEMRRVFIMAPSIHGMRTVEMTWDGIGEWLG